MRVALPIVLSLSVSNIAFADEATPPATQQVTVSGSKDPDWKPYRKMLDGLNAFDKFHALAPSAELKFILRPQQPNLDTTGLKLRIVGDNTSIDVPIAADHTFSVPRVESAAKDDADLRLNSKLRPCREDTGWGCFFSAFY